MKFARVMLKRITHLNKNINLTVISLLYNLLKIKPIILIIN